MDASCGRRLAREGVNHLRDSFALNMMKPSRGPGTFSPSLLMLVRQRSPPRRQRHQDKRLMAERKAATGLMPLRLLFAGAVCVCSCLYVCVARVWLCLCAQKYIYACIFLRMYTVFKRLCAPHVCPASCA